MSGWRGGTPRTARVDANTLGVMLSNMSDEGSALTPVDCYKSIMPTHVDRTVWQDVYRPSTSADNVYLQRTVIDDVLIVSLKAL
jgi:motility quorum-sensing regulator/GCU-specific mRNA interferase toxin